MSKKYLRFLPFILSVFYGGAFAYFISSANGEEVYGMLYNLPMGPAWAFMGIFIFLGVMLQGAFELITYFQHKTPRKPSQREENLNKEIARLKAQNEELHKELASKTPLAM